jgi:hypothetical protein
MAKTDWFRLLGYVTGLVNQELLLNNEYLPEGAHQRTLTAVKKATLAEIAKRLGRKRLGADCPRGEARYDAGLATKFDCPEVRRGEAALRPRAATGWIGA